MVCTKQYTPVCTKNATATSTTSDPLTNAWNLTTAAFVLLNDDVDDGGDDLVVGNPVRLRPWSEISLPSDY